MVQPVLYLHETSLISGAENSLIQLVRHLDTNQFRPVFILPGQGPLSEALESSGIKVYFAHFPRVRSGIGVMSAITEMIKIAREEGAEIIHSNSIRTHIYGAITGRSTASSVVWHERNLITNERFDPDKVLSFLPDSIICNSRAIARRFESRGRMPDKVSIIHNGVDTALFNPDIIGQDVRERSGIKPGDIVIGIASRLNAEKGHETFFNAAKILLSGMPGISGKLRFLVAGGPVFENDRQEEERLKSLVRDLGLGENTIFTGFSRDMPGIYASMDVTVLASSAEPCGRVVSEAMAMGRPLIATNSGGTPEMVIDGVTGILVPPQEAVPMAEAMRSLVIDKSKRLSMGREGRKRAEELFDIRAVSKKVAGVYLALLSRKGLNGPREE